MLLNTHRTSGSAVSVLQCLLNTGIGLGSQDFVLETVEHNSACQSSISLHETKSAPAEHLPAFISICWLYTSFTEAQPAFIGTCDEKSMLTLQAYSSPYKTQTAVAKTPPAFTSPCESNCQSFTGLPKLLRDSNCPCQALPAFKSLCNSKYVLSETQKTYSECKHHLPKFYQISLVVSPLAEFLPVFITFCRIQAVLAKPLLAFITLCELHAALTETLSAFTRFCRTQAVLTEVLS